MPVRRLVANEPFEQEHRRLGILSLLTGFAGTRPDVVSKQVLEISAYKMKFCEV